MSLTKARRVLPSMKVHVVQLCLFIATTAFLFLLAACAAKPVEEFSPTETSLPPLRSTAVPATQTPTPEPVSNEITGQWEVIQPGNLMRLQLLKTFPAEIPMQYSSLAISPDGKTLAIGSNSTSAIFFIDLSGGSSSWNFQVNTQFQGAFNAIQYLPDETLLASSPVGYESYHIDTSGDILATWGYPFAVSTDGKTAAVGDNAGTVLIDVIDNEALGSLEGNVVLSLSFSPDGSKLAVSTAGVDYLTGNVWDIASQTLLATLEDIGDLRFSPDGKFLIATSSEGDLSDLKIFDAQSQTQLATLKGSQSLDGAAPLLSPDGRMILARIADGSPVAWDTTNWQPIEMPALDGQLDLFSPDGRILVTRGADGAILFWGVDQ
jgi:WD40 repeat protein